MSRYKIIPNLQTTVHTNAKILQDSIFNNESRFSLQQRNHTWFQR